MIYEKLVDLTGNSAVPLVLVSISSYLYYSATSYIDFKVGNKSDLHAERAVSEATGKKLAADMKVTLHVLCSISSSG